MTYFNQIELKNSILCLFAMIKYECIYLLWAGCDTILIFQQSLTGLNSEFTFPPTGLYPKVEEADLPYYLFIARYMPLSRVLALFEMQTTLFRIWTWVAMSISYDDNRYTMSALKLDIKYIVKNVWILEETLTIMDIYYLSASSAWWI